MSQSEVYDFLRSNHNKWFSSKELSLIMPFTLSSLGMNLKKLRKANLIDSKQEGITYYYKTKKEVKEDAV